MKILVIGSGGREHALAWKLAQSQRVAEVLVAPGNAGTAREPKCRNVAIKVTDLDGLLALAQGEGVALTVVGPEVPLVAGVVDRFRAASLRIFGPSAAAAQLEGSKAYAKDFLARHGIPTAFYAVHTDVDAALAANAAHHAEFDIAPGIPVNVLSRDAHAQALRQAMQDVSAGRSVDVASIVEPAAFTNIPARRSIISQALDEMLSQADEGATSRALEMRTLEDQAAQILPRGDRKVYQSEIANSERIITNLTEQRNQILAEQPAGSGKALSRARADKQERLRDVDQRISEAQGRLEFSRNSLAPHEPGGEFFEARAEIARRQQAEAELDAQALSFFRTAEVRSADEVAPLEPNVALRDMESVPAPRPAENQQDIDVMAAEESLAESPDMIITVLDEDGNPQSRSAREVLDDAARENEQAVQDSRLFDVAVACFLRG